MSLKSTLVFILAFATSPAFAHEALQLENGHWWNGQEFVEKTMYSVEGRLQAEPPETVDGMADLSGGWVVPPLADAHSHALADADFDRTSKQLLAQGVFYLQNPNSLRTFTREPRLRAADVTTVDVTYSLGCLTSSGGHPVQVYDQAASQIEGWTPERMAGEAYYLIDDASALAATWPAITSGRPDFLKVILERSEEHEARRDDPAFYGQRGLDPKLLPMVVERAHAAGMRVAVHVTSREDFLVAIESGADELAHLPLEPLEAADAIAAAKAGIVVTTTTLSHRPTDEVDDVDALHRHNLQLMVEHEVRMVLGTDSHRSILDEAQNLVRLGVPRDFVLRLAVEDTPQWIFPDRKIGRLEPGAEASFLVLSSDPRHDLAAFSSIQLAVKQGQMVDLATEPELPQIAQTLAHTLMREGLEATLTEFHRMAKEEPDSWDFREPQLNALAYFALQQDRPQDAVVIFQLNAERFPESSNVWDSLGDGMSAAGDTEGARHAYQRALTLDPGAENSREKLEKLSGSDG
jgi:imidazolonepropionase-like amidohydrolase